MARMRLPIGLIKAVARKAARGRRRRNTTRRSGKFPMWVWIVGALVGVIALVKPLREKVMAMFHKK